MIKKLRFYAVVVIPGATLMALEIVSSRLLAPHFGSSVYVWGSIISVFLAAMSIGYVWGGRLADSRPRLANLGELLVFAGATQAVILLFGRKLVSLLGAWTGGAPWGTLLATAALFGLPTVLLATVAPYAVKLATRNMGILGATAGQLYAISTAGSLVGTLGATFWLIPYLPLDSILSLLLALTVLSGAAALTEGWRDHRLSALLAASLLFLSLRGGLIPQSGGPILAERMTAYQTISVSEFDDTRFLRSDGTLHAAVMVDTGEPWMQYPRIAAGSLLFNSEAESFLLLGMGGGTVGTYLSRRVPQLLVEYVDIDPAMPELARTWLYFRDDERNVVHVDDARHFLSRSAHKWDIVYVDTYVGHSIPFHLSTVEFFEEVAAHIEVDGIMAVNLIADASSPYGSALIRTVLQAFRQVYVFNVPGGNQLLVATSQENRWSRAQILDRARELDDRWVFDPPLAEIAGLLRLDPVDLSSAQLLRDEFAPVNHLVQLP